MRPSPTEARLIRETAEAHFGTGTIVRLVGSRSDNARRCGDIDLQVNLPGPGRFTV